MGIAAICEAYGWTYNEYLDQPAWFLDVVAIKMAIEAQVQEKRNRKPK